MHHFVIAFNSILVDDLNTHGTSRKFPHKIGDLSVLYAKFRLRLKTVLVDNYVVSDIQNTARSLTRAKNDSSY